MLAERDKLGKIPSAGGTKPGKSVKNFKRRIKTLKKKISALKRKVPDSGDDSDDDDDDEPINDAGNSFGGRSEKANNKKKRNNWWYLASQLQLWTTCLCIVFIQMWEALVQLFAK